MTSTKHRLSPSLARVKNEMALGKRIVWARKRKGISQEQLAKTIGTSRRHMIRIENGTVKQPGPAFVSRIAEATDCPSELFEDDDQEGESRGMTLDDFLRLRVNSLLREALESNDPAAHLAASTAGSSTTGG